MRQLKTIIVIVLVIIIVVAVSGALMLRSRTYPPHDEALAWLESATKHRGYYLFEADDADLNVVFYPGGLVRPEAYAGLALQMAASGMRVFLVVMPLNLAILNTNAIDTIMDNHPSELPWVIGGHSLGGASAAIWLARHPDQADGLFLLAAYPASSSDLSASDLPVISIRASADDVLDMDNFAATQGLLPEDTVYAVIEGGNHAGFGHYGPQKGDGVASLDRETQQLETVVLLRQWFEAHIQLMI